MNILPHPKADYTLYVDGACRGNPGMGGWGAVIIASSGQQYELYGGMQDTTNNRMELMAAIEGISACPTTATLAVYTDSSYVHKGITTWITGWKAKQWRAVKNVELWQKLDAVCQGRRISWHWVKGHSGDAGNEYADQLANRGADGQHHRVQIDSSPAQHDPHTQLSSSTAPLSAQVAPNPVDTAALGHHLPHSMVGISITPTTYPQQGPRYLILDTETTGFYHQQGDRIIEIGAIEMINRKLTGNSLHIYLNPQKPVGESEAIHGLSDAFLADKPTFDQVAQLLYDYLKGAHIVAHNATFDMGFLDSEFERSGLGKLSQVVEVTDTLALARHKHPGQKNTLDALVRRYEVPERDRTFHGALLDAEILHDVYLAMTGGQVSFDMGQDTQTVAAQQHSRTFGTVIQTPVIKPEPEEYAAHLAWLEQYQQRYGKSALFEQASTE